MASRFVFEGLEELKVQLRMLPRTLTGKASTIVRSAADAAANDARNGYPQHTGNLRRGVKVSSHAEGTFGIGAVVKNDAPHAALFEMGTETRRTKKGWNRGAMPPGRVFIPAMRKHRRPMYEQLKKMLVDEGLIVTGDER